MGLNGGNVESCSIEYGIEWPDHRPTYKANMISF